MFQTLSEGLRPHRLLQDVLLLQAAEIAWVWQRGRFTSKAPSSMRVFFGAWLAGERLCRISPTSADFVSLAQAATNAAESFGFVSRVAQILHRGACWEILFFGCFGFRRWAFGPCGAKRATTSDACRACSTFRATSAPQILSCGAQRATRPM